MAKLLAMVLFLMVLSTCASAEILEPNVYVEELNMSFVIPSHLYILTRDMAADDPLLGLIGMDQVSVAEHMAANQLYMDAFPSDFSCELTVAMEENALSNFRDYGDELLDQLRERMAEIFAENSMTVTATDIYKNDAADYIKVYYNDSRSGSCVLQYYTIVDYKAINLRIFSHDGAVTADQEALLKSVVDNAVFNAK